MKKYLVAALAASTALVFATVALATGGHTMTATTTITKAGTKKKPKAAGGTIQIVTDTSFDPTVDVFTYQFPKQLKVSTRGFKYCTLTQLSEAQTDEVCPKGSKVGTGFAQARIGSRSQGALLFDVAIYADKGAMTLWLTDRSGLDIRRAIPIVIADGTDGFGQNLISDIPEDVEYTAGVKVVLEQVDVTLDATRKKVVRRNGRKRTIRYHVLSSVGCPSSKQLTLGTKLTYKEPPGHEATSATDTVACS